MATAAALRRIAAGLALAVLLFAALAAGFGVAHAQNAVQELAPITPGHAAMWFADGQIGDAGGPPGNALAPVNNANAGTLPLGFASVNAGLNDCRFTNYAGNPYNEFCFGFEAGGNALLQVDRIGSGALPQLDCLINHVLISPCLGPGAASVTNVQFVGDGTVDSATPTPPCATDCTLTATLLTQAAHTALMGPASGSAAAPTFRRPLCVDILDAGAGCAGSVASLSLTATAPLTISPTPFTGGAGTLGITIPTANLLGGAAGNFTGVTVGAQLLLSSGTLSAPLATGASFGTARPDNTTITIAGGVLSAIAIPSGCAVGAATGILYSNGTGCDEDVPHFYRSATTGNGQTLGVGVVHLIGQDNNLEPDYLAMTLSGAGTQGHGALRIYDKTTNDYMAFGKVDGGIAYLNLEGNNLFSICTLGNCQVSINNDHPDDYALNLGAPDSNGLIQVWHGPGGIQYMELHGQNGGSANSTLTGGCFGAPAPQCNDGWQLNANNTVNSYISSPVSFGQTTNPTGVAVYIHGTATIDGTTTCNTANSALQTDALGTISCGSITTGTTFANPTATIGTAAVPGSATTAMRSDASPAIPQASSSTFGAMKVDGTTETASAGVVSTAPTTINGTSCTPGGSCTVSSAASALVVGTTTITSGTTNGLLYDNAGVLGNLASGNNGVLVTSGAGVPSVSTTLPSGLAATNLALTTPALGTPSAGVLTNATGLPLTTGVTGILGATNGGTGINNGTFTLTLGVATTLPAAPASTQCLHMDNTGAVAATGADCNTSGSGTVNSGTAGQLAYYATSTNAVSGAASATISTGALSLGASGTAGSVAMGNATSGTVTLQPVTGALGTVTASLPANTGTIAETNLAQTFSATQTFGAVLGTGRTVAGTTDTLAATDCGTVVEYTSGSATTVTTLASIVSGTQICSIGIYQHGAGQVTISDGASATHVSANACTKTSAQFALLSLAVYAGVGVSEYNIGGQCS